MVTRRSWARLGPGYLRGGACRTGTERGALGARRPQIPGWRCLSAWASRVSYPS